MRAALFDLFGTLVESPLYISPYAPFLRRIPESRGARSRAIEHIQCRASESIEELAAELSRRFEAPLYAPAEISRVKADLDRHIASYQPLPASIELLASIQGMGIATACVSNLAAPYRLVFSQNGIGQWIDHIVFSCEVGLIKPQPEIYAHALALLDVPAHRAVMVGDNLIDDVEGARAAGLHAVWVDASRPWRRETLDFLKRSDA